MNLGYMYVSFRSFLCVFVYKWERQCELLIPYSELYAPVGEKIERNSQQHSSYYQYIFPRNTKVLCFLEYFSSLIWLIFKVGLSFVNFSHLNKFGPFNLQF